jgi:type IV pilus assembly PilX-like protein
MYSRLRSEEGWTLVTAIILMTIMLGVGLATASMVDTQAKQSAGTRQRDTAFNLAEAALNAQVYALSLRWPGYGYNVATAYRSYACAGTGAEPTLGSPPANQQQLVTAVPVCPSPATLARLVNNVDAQGASWRTWVYDDPSSTASAADRGKFYSDALVAAGDSITTPAGTVPTAAGVGYDSNKDGRLWVKASATARGHTRTLVSLVKVDTFQQDVMNTALLAGSLDFSNNGNHSGYFIDQSSGTGANVITVRCDPATPPSATCLGYPASDRNWSAEIGGAINPPNYGAVPSAPNALDAPALDALMGVALTDQTYYDNLGPRTCSQLSSPPSFTFNVLYIKDCGLISWSSNATLNSPEAPGIVILDNTRLRVTGNVSINGIVYARRPPAESPTVEMKGCSQIAGGLIIDDMGAASIGSCSQADTPELLFVPTAFKAFKTYTSAGVIQNTWRELAPR